MCLQKAPLQLSCNPHYVLEGCSKVFSASRAAYAGQYNPITEVALSVCHTLQGLSNSRFIVVITIIRLFSFIALSLLFHCNYYSMHSFTLKRVITPYVIIYTPIFNNQ